MYTYLLDHNANTVSLCTFYFAKFSLYDNSMASNFKNKYKNVIFYLTFAQSFSSIPSK